MLSLRDVILVHDRGEPNEIVALQSLSIDIPAGQFVTIIGSNGAGKSSLVKIISGEHAPTAGTVSIDGLDVSRKGPHARAHLVARVFDDPRTGTVPDLSIEENMALALRRGNRRALRRAVGERRRVIMREALERLGLGLEQRLSDPAGLLSAGQRQSLTMVMATLAPTKVLLLDEHVAALDPATQRRVLDLTTEVARVKGCTTVMVTHNMRHALELGDRLLVLSRGRVVADLSEQEKRTKSVDDLVAAIVHAGDSPLDRNLLPEI